MRVGFQHVAALVALALGAGCVSSPPRMQTRVVDSGGARIVVHDLGRGPVIMMVPSVGRSTADFADLAREMSRAGWHVVLPEPRGTAGSTGPTEGLTLEDYGRDLVAVARSTGAQPVVILGHAAGARDARMAIGLAPERFSRLISLATGAGGGRFGSARVGSEALDKAQEGIIAQGEKPDAERLKDLQLIFFAPGNDASVWLTGWTPAAARAHSAASRRTPRERWWPGRSIPSLIVEAAEDPVAPAQGDKLKALLGADAKVVLLPRASHAILPEQPRAVAALVAGYLNGASEAALQAIADRDAH